MRLNDNMRVVNAGTYAMKNEQAYAIRPNKP